MKLTSSKEFSVSMETAWKALQKPSSLDISPGSEVTVISDTEWTAKTAGTDGRELTESRYTATFDEEKKMVIIEGVSDSKRSHDFIYLTLTETASDKVTLGIEVEINTGMHLIAKALGEIFLRPMEKIMCGHIYQNFEALCAGKETKRMSRDELDARAKDELSK